MMTINKKCRICESEKLTKIIDLVKQPLANAFLRKEDLVKPEDTYPLEVYFCADCNFAQLIHVVDKEVLFRDYIYFSSGMPRLSDHFRLYAEDVMARFLKSGNLVVELGSNDGILLAHFKERGFRVLGVDPALNIARVAEKRGVRTIADFWSEVVAKNIKNDAGEAMAILGNNVVAHINDYEGLCRGVKELLEPRGVFIFEAPYLIDMFENLAFDIIYHEHLSYLAIRPLQKLFAKYGLEIFEVKIVPSQGQSIRVFVGHKGEHNIDMSVEACVRKELALGLDKLESYNELAKKIALCKERTLTTLRKLKNDGKKIAAYGAPAKGNTLLNYYGIGADLLDFAMDELPSKQWLYTPGTHVRVVDKQFADAARPDYYLLLAWNYAPIILEKEKQFLQNGGKFVLPTGEVIKSDLKTNYYQTHAHTQYI
jgi:SAM-dependent methyltransferase